MTSKADLASRLGSFAVLAAALLLATSPVGSASTTLTASPVQSSLSVFLSCSEGISFAATGSSSSCGSGTYSAVYSGIAQVVGSNKTSRFYLASATGGVKVTFNLTDESTGNLLFKGVGYGAISGGSCASSSAVVPTTFTTYPETVGSGDNLSLSLGIIFTGTGTPTFCSGGGSATLLSVGTAVAAGSSQPLLTTTLTAGRPHVTTLSGYVGIAESYVGNSNGAFTAFVFGIVKNSAGATVEVLTSSVAVSTGANSTAFIPFNPVLSPGTYTVSVVATASNGVPVSTTAEATVVA